MNVRQARAKVIKGHGLIAKAKKCYEKAYEALENNRARRHNNLIFNGDYYQRKDETLIEEVKEAAQFNRKLREAWIMSES